MDKYICVHGHFYQPPRENPWLERIELQDSAYPYHDWNQRITAECYEPNLAARILGPDFKIIDIHDNYAKMSFNFGPTLLYGMEKDRPEVYRGIIEADRKSRENFSGHGSALAQVYNHMIMPLANKRDKHTQVLWGIKDFRKRFGREPEGMWLPETAADTETLEVLAELGIKFTILAPRQAKRVKKNAKDAKWKDLTADKIDTAAPYLCRLPSGRSIAIFFYNGEISQEVGFGSLLDNGENFAKRLASAFPQDDRPSALVHIATDGESYGHHRKHGDMALSYCIYHIESNALAKLTNYAEYLEKFPPDSLVEIWDGSSWSCVHGIGRWQSDCGCNSGMHPGWQQKWRSPLRDALDWLRDTLSPLFEREGAKYFKDPWEARNSYIDVINDRSAENVEAFLAAHSKRALSGEEKVRALKLLGIQRNAMLMYSSCGWFFDEVSGIETVQVMQYAARAIQLTEEVTGLSLDGEFSSMLEQAPSNIYEDGEYVYENFAKPARIDLLRVGAHQAIAALFTEHSRRSFLYCYEVDNEFYERTESGKLKLAIGKSFIRSIITWEEAKVAFAVLHLGDTNVSCGIKYNSEEEFPRLESELLLAFEKGDVPQIIRVMDRHFQHNFTLWHLFKDDQRRVVNAILEMTYSDIETSYRHIFEDKYNTMDFLRKLYIPLPRPLYMSAEYVLNLDIKNIFSDEGIDTGRLNSIIRTANHLDVSINPETLGYVVSLWVNSRLNELSRNPEDVALIDRVREVLRLLGPLSVNLNLWKAQNVYFSLAREKLSGAGDKPLDQDMTRWVESFSDLGNLIHVKVI